VDVSSGGCFIVYVFTFVCVYPRLMFAKCLSCVEWLLLSSLSAELWAEAMIVRRDIRGAMQANYTLAKTTTEETTILCISLQR